MNIINPATEEIIAEVEVDTPQVIQSVYEILAEGQRRWVGESMATRLACIERFDQLLDQQQDELAKILTSEMGKPLAQAKGEIQGARSRIAWFLAHAEKALADEWIVQESGNGQMISWDPLGVIGNISAWNYPYLVGVNVFIPALLAGNSVMYKPSEYATLTGLKIEELLHQAGIPRNVFQMVTGGKEAGEAMLDLPLDGYFFTGSNRTGQYIYEKVAKKMVPCQMELGGKDPLYVSADNQNIVAVAQAAAEGAFYNAGQSCCAVERIYVHHSLYEAFTEAFVAEVSTYTVGDPMADGTFIGPLARKSQVEFLQKQVGDAVVQGAEILFGEERWQGKGAYFIPTVLGDVNHEMKIMQEESFGPVIGIQAVQDDTEAIELMQDTRYGLTAAVYADHWKHAEPILRKMNTGSVYWNCCDRLRPGLPWSGRKHSGIGTTLSYLGVRSFAQAKAFHLNGSWES